MRELENAIERAVTLAEGAVIDADVAARDAPRRWRRRRRRRELRADARRASTCRACLDERRAALPAAGAASRPAGVKTEAAKLLGLTFRSMRYRLAKQGLAKPGRDEGQDR